MSKFTTLLCPNRVHYLSTGLAAEFHDGEVIVPDAQDAEMEAAGFTKVVAPKKPIKKEKPVAEEPVSPVEE